MIQHMGKPKKLSLDNGSEFKGVFAQYNKDNMIELKLGRPYCSNHQAFIERINRDFGNLLASSEVLVV